MSEANPVKIDLDLPLSVPNNISKFQMNQSSKTEVIERRPKRDGRKDGR